MQFHAGSDLALRLVSRVQNQLPARTAFNGQWENSLIFKVSQTRLS